MLNPSYAESRPPSEAAAHTCSSWLEEAEGEGFEPSIRLTTDNGFRDRTQTADLQVVCNPFASTFASQPARLQRADVRRHFAGIEGSTRWLEVGARPPGVCLRRVDCAPDARIGTPDDRPVSGVCCIGWMADSGLPEGISMAAAVPGGRPSPSSQKTSASRVFRPAIASLSARDRNRNTLLASLARRLRLAQCPHLDRSWDRASRAPLLTRSRRLWQIRKRTPEKV